MCCLFAACKKDDAVTVRNDSPTLVFGSFYGECTGEKCVEIYSLDSQKKTLAEDVTEVYPNSDSPFDGSFVPLKDSYYEQVSDLPALFPNELLQETKTTIGAPDAADQGGYYVEVNHNGVRRHWLIDTNKQAIPAYLHPFVDALSARLQLLP